MKCNRCGNKFDKVITYPQVTPQYCFTCRTQRQQESNKRSERKRRQIVAKETHAIIQQKPIKVNLCPDWYNAGLFCGTQGHLRDKFFELLHDGDDFLPVVDALKRDPKWEAEIKGLDHSQRRAWLRGFFTGINKFS